MYKHPHGNVKVDSLWFKLIFIVAALTLVGICVRLALYIFSQLKCYF